MSGLKLSEKRSLRYEFSAVELHDLGLELANKHQEMARIEADLKRVKSQFKSQQDAAAALINKLSDNVASGYEVRDVDCAIKWHYPEQGRKTYVRGDTGEEFTEKMSNEEYDLFNQWNEANPSGTNERSGNIHTEDGVAEDVTPKLKELGDGSIPSSTDEEVNDFIGDPTKNQL